MKITNDLAIGVFDSGLGGLTVVKELHRQLPNESLIYVGDTARVPYGTKSPEAIRRYALEIAFFLLQKKVKVLVVACNSASAVALRPLKNFPIPVVGVIEPGVRAAILNTKTFRVGVIGTPATVESHAYRSTIKRYSRKARVWEAPCPLFVPLVEEGWLNTSVTNQVAKTYLNPLLKKKIDTLVLGCTHYPVLKPVLKRIIGKNVSMIDSADETAGEVKRLLKKNKFLNPTRSKKKMECYVTDRPRTFSRLAEVFLGRRIGPAKRLSLEDL